MRNHFKHSVELVDREGDIVDVLAAVEDFSGPALPPDRSEELGDPPQVARSVRCA